MDTKRAIAAGRGRFRHSAPVFTDSLEEHPEFGMQRRLGQIRLQEVFAKMNGRQALIVR